jgi:ribosomal RNA assembly protein
MTAYSYDIKIPLDRVAVLIGKNGEKKKELEEDTHTKIIIDSKEGDVTVTGEDAIDLFTTREIIKAVGRGFNPDIAKQLLKQDNVLEIINIQDFSGKARDSQERLKGRVIGREGKTRTLIEDLTDTNVSVYGKTVAIIGNPENTAAARRAIILLLTGSMHSAVYKMLEGRRAQMRKNYFEEIKE